MVTADMVRLRVHAAKRMLERGISMADVLVVINDGVIIEAFTVSQVQPFGKRLSLAFVNGRALHVAYALAPNGTAHVFTVYEPTEEYWDDGFTRRKA